MNYSSQVALMYPIFSLVVAFSFLFLFGLRGVKVSGYISSIVALVVVFVTVEHTKYDQTDWTAYLSADVELLDRDIIKGDWLFWRLLLYSNEILEPSRFHLILKTTSAVVAYIVSRQLMLSQNLSLLVAAVWTGTTGFSLGADWYIRQSLANHLCVIGWSRLLVTNIATKTQFRSLGWTQYVLPSAILGFSVLIHFGVLALNMMVAAIIFSFQKLIKRVIRGDKIDSVAMMSWCVLVGVMASLVIGIGTPFLNKIVSEEILKYGSHQPPVSLLIQAVVFFVCFSILINIKTDLIGETSTVQKNDLIFVRFGAVYHVIIFQILSSSMAIGISYGYILRINMFKDFYSVISIGILTKILESRSLAQYHGRVYAMLLLQSLYLLVISTSTGLK